MCIAQWVPKDFHELAVPRWHEWHSYEVYRFLFGGSRPEVRQSDGRAAPWRHQQEPLTTHADGDLLKGPALLDVVALHLHVERGHVRSRRRLGLTACRRRICSVGEHRNPQCHLRARHVRVGVRLLSNQGEYRHGLLLALPGKCRRQRLRHEEVGETRWRGGIFPWRRRCVAIGDGPKLSLRSSRGGGRLLVQGRQLHADISPEG
mmetsp:Transcript_79318/g.220597  ORF Transcript_79318/g.220597 Transcript_79318/m.220597 type:complete len:205 (+) Transcript_79318:1963-2577(+)